jgi:hypothetical protein
MTKHAAIITACLLIGGSGGAAAQERSYACSKICWNPATGAAICTSVLATQIQLTSYIWAAQHDIIVKGKGLTFSLPLKTPWQNCASEDRKGRWLAVAGYVTVKSVIDFTVGGLKVGDTIEISGIGVAADQKNVLFFADPSHE